MRDNVKRKLHELGITGSVAAEIVSDIFGKVLGEVTEGGLSTALQAKILTLHLIMLQANGPVCIRIVPNSPPIFSKRKQRLSVRAQQRTSAQCAGLFSAQGLHTKCK